MPNHSLAPCRHGSLLFDRFGGAPLSHRPCNHVGRSARAGYVARILRRFPRFDLALLISFLFPELSETKFHVKPLPHARIPIVKLSLDPSVALPLGIACDIGFENRLALENTRLLYCYAMIDPTRLRTLVLFRESGIASNLTPHLYSRSHFRLNPLSPNQSRCGVNEGTACACLCLSALYVLTCLPHRKINSPYQGTLSSYGYVLLVIYFLVHVKNPPVLPNLQQMPPMRPISHACLTPFVDPVHCSLTLAYRMILISERTILGMYSIDTRC